MTNARFSPHSKERGQSLVEFAISLTVIMMLLAGAVEFGIALFQFVQLRDAAQEGALYGSIHPGDDANIEARVRSASLSPIDLQNDPDVTVVISYPDGAPNCEGKGIQVNVSYPHRIGMPFIGPIIGSNTIPLTGSVTDTILRPICP
ncbi:MAG: pilus assembly protein [Anaerolineales bacterium]|nr:pilus assembly protein [Anaerolineales bacterium]